MLHGGLNVQDFLANEPNKEIILELIAFWVYRAYWNCTPGTEVHTEPRDNCIVTRLVNTSATNC